MKVLSDGPCMVHLIFLFKSFNEWTGHTKSKDRRHSEWARKTSKEDWSENNIMLK